MVQIAVVGAGIGGCSFSYFAKKHIPNAEVTIYEAENRLGGRVLTKNISGIPFELGAAFFNDTNKIIMELVEAEQLKVSRLEERKDFAVWNGSKLIFRSSKQSAVTDAKLLAKYRLSLARTFLLIREAKRQFANLYAKEQKVPSDIGDLLEAAGLNKWYSKSINEILLSRGISQGFIDEIVSPITRIIYNQHDDIGGLAGIASLIGVYSKSTFSLTKGNDELPMHLAKTSNAKIKLGPKSRQHRKNIQRFIHSIRRQGSGSVRLRSYCCTPRTIRHKVRRIPTPKLGASNLPESLPPNRSRNLQPRLPRAQKHREAPKHRSNNKRG